MDQRDRRRNQNLSLADLAALLGRHRRLLSGLVIFGGCLGLFFALNKPVAYQAEATFREKSSKGIGNSGNSLLHLFGGDAAWATSSEQEAKSTLKSRKVLEAVIGGMQLQAKLTSEEINRDAFWKRMYCNLKTAWAYFRNSPFPCLHESPLPIAVQALSYSGETPLYFWIHLEPSGRYELRQKKQGEVVARGKLGVLCEQDNVSFILASLPEISLSAPAHFGLEISPLAGAAKALESCLKVESDKEDKSVIRILLQAPDRHLASRLANTLMDVYQNYLKECRDRLSQTQLDYLNKRQRQLAQNLTEQMERQAQFLSEDLFTAGFINSEKEMDFLAHNQHDYKEKLMANELEIKRLESMEPENYVYYEAYARNGGDSGIINSLLNEIRGFKQQRDGLEIELQKNSSSLHQGLVTVFDAQVAELEEVQRCLAEVQDINDRFRQQLQPDPSSKLLEDPRFLMKSWLERLQRLSDPKERHKAEGNFQFYLNNLERLFHVYEKILYERLSHRQNSSQEFQGISLKVADQLYTQYCAQLVKVESATQQLLFLNSQMQEPAFAMTSLSAELEDAVSQEMIKKANQLILSLKDESNRTQKEQERLKDELDLQRAFLGMHMQQMAQLMQLDKQLIYEKIKALQSLSLELIQQQISLLENTLKDYISSRLENLHQDRLLIQEHLKQIRLEMGALPKKWMAEQLIEQEVATNQLIVEEIAKMVESKNISHHIGLVQSAPIDCALPPLHPVPPPLLLFSFAGAFLGGLGGIAFMLGRTLFTGFFASPDNLGSMGHHVSGTLTYPLEECPALRRLSIWMEPPSRETAPSEGRQMLLIESEAFRYGAALGKLLAQRGKKVVLIELDFSGEAPSDAVSLLDYLNKKQQMPTLIKMESGLDKIYSGEKGNFCLQQLFSPLFQQLIQKLQKNFDWILVVTRAKPLDVEITGLLRSFSCAAVAVQNETVDALAPFHDLLNHSECKVSFLFSDLCK